MYKVLCHYFVILVHLRHCRVLHPKHFAKESVLAYETEYTQTRDDVQILQHGYHTTDKEVNSCNNETQLHLNSSDHIYGSIWLPRSIINVNLLLLYSCNHMAKSMRN